MLHEANHDICTSHATNQVSGFIKSPNYPLVASTQHSCECSLTSTPNSNISLTILDLKGCQHNSLLLEYNGLQVALCDHQKRTRTSQRSLNSNEVRLTFNNKVKDKDHQFWIKYDGKCFCDLKITNVDNIKMWLYIITTIVPKIF